MAAAVARTTTPAAEVNSDLELAALRVRELEAEADAVHKQAQELNKAGRQVLGG
jgi:hypothetical protein